MKVALTTILRDGFILVFNQDKLDVVQTAEALMKAGVSNMEVTCRISKPLEKMQKLRKVIPEFVIGAASLIDLEPVREICNRNRPDDPVPTLQEVVDAGCDYLVSAVNFSDASYEKFAGKTVMVPGCGSAHEVVSQFARGANMCKVFPAKQLGGAGFVKAIDPAIHKTISMVPMGGTNPQNMGDYIKAGVLVLGGSFSLISKETMARIIDEQDYDLLAAELTEVKGLIDELRASMYSHLDFATATLGEISEKTGRLFNL